jgi:DNA-directed RNA polymerase specialized sigma24 family protein
VADVVNALHRYRAFEWNRSSSAPFSKKEEEREMRKAIAELDAEERAALLYLADLGTAVCAAGFIVSLLKLIVDVL